MSERITRQGHSIGCLCGNWPDQEGFLACLKDGTPVEPVESGPWDGRLYVCGRRGRIVDQVTLEVSGRTCPASAWRQAATTHVAHEPGDLIEYTFGPAGYWPGQVIKYAPGDEQTRTCPECEHLVVPGAGAEGSLRRCPRCQALCRFPAVEPLVYIRARSGSEPFKVRASQLRRPEIAG